MGFFFCIIAVFATIINATSSILQTPSREREFPLFLMNEKPTTPCNAYDLYYSTLSQLSEAPFDPSTRFAIRYNMAGWSDISEITFYLGTVLIPRLEPYVFEFNVEIPQLCPALQSFADPLDGDPSLSHLFPQNLVPLKGPDVYPTPSNGKYMTCTSSTSIFGLFGVHSPLAYITTELVDVTDEPGFDIFKCRMNLYIARTRTYANLLVCHGRTPIIKVHPDQLPKDGKFKIVSISPETAVGIQSTSFPEISPRPLNFELSLDYITGQDVQDQPRMDYLLITMQDPPANSIIDFGIAFDHSQQKRLDRIFFLDEPVLWDISRYWATSNDPQIPSVTCGSPNIRIVFRTPTLQDDDGNSMRSLSLVTVGSIFPKSAICKIPIPIHLIYSRLMTVPWLDIGVWNGLPFSIYLQLTQANRLYRHHPIESRAKWNFFNPVLTPSTTVITNNYFDSTSSIMHFRYNLLIIGPKPEIIFEDSFPISPSTFAKDLFHTDHSFLKRFEYITNPINYKSPTIFPPIDDDSEFFQHQPLFLSNYNGFVNITIHFDIPHFQLQPFFIQFNINKSPFIFDFLPATRQTYQLYRSSDFSTITTDYNIQFINHWDVRTQTGDLIKLLPHPLSTPVTLFSLSLAVQPRILPFELIEPASRLSPFCTGRILESDQEIEPLFPLEPIVKKNDLLTSLYSSTTSSSIEVKNVFLTLDQEFLLRCTFTSIDATIQPYPFNSPDVPLTSTLRLHQPFLYTHISPPKLFVPNTNSQSPKPQHNSLNLINIHNNNDTTQPLSEPITSNIINFAIYTQLPIKNAQDVKSLLDFLTWSVSTSQYYLENDGAPHPGLLESVTISDWRFGSDDFDQISQSWSYSFNYPGTIFDLSTPELHTSPNTNTRSLSFFNTGSVVVGLVIDIPKKYSVDTFSQALTRHVFQSIHDLPSQNNACYIIHYLSISLPSLVLPRIVDHIEQLFPSASQISPTTTTSAVTIDAPLPARSPCLSDAECLSNLMCIKHQCLSQLSLATLHLNEMFVIDLYENQMQHRAGLPSHFAIYFANNVEEKESFTTFKLSVLLFSVSSVIIILLTYIIYRAIRLFQDKKNNNIEYSSDGEDDDDEDEDDDDDDDDDDDFEDFAERNSSN